MSLRIGYAAGAFDLFHVGHLNILKHAKSNCDYLIAGVVSDEMLQLTKGITPFIPLAERLEIVRHISYVDEARAEVLPDKLDTWRDWLMARIAEKVAVDGDGLALDFVCPAREISIAGYGLCHIDGSGNGDRLAVVHRFEAGQCVTVALDKIRETIQKPSAL